MSTLSTASTSDKENELSSLERSSIRCNGKKAKLNYCEDSQSDDEDVEKELDFSGSKGEDEGNSSSDSDLMEPILVKKRKGKRDLSGSNNGDSDYSKDTLPASPAPSDESHETSSPRSRDRSESPETPEGQWEIEEILDFMRDDFGDYYLVKWKDWEAEYNTWEPPTNLLNCEGELLRFYRKKKEEAREALENCEYIELANGKRRKKVRVRDVPPDPRPFDVRVQEFFDVTGNVADEDVVKVFLQWKSKSISAKARWSRNKVNKFLEDGVDGKLSDSDVKALKDELILIEVDNRKRSLSNQIQRMMLMSLDLPSDLNLSTIYVGDGVDIPKDPPVGCNCGKGPTSCYDERATKCCAVQFEYKFAYTKYRKVNVLQGSPIYECNSKCSCGPDCPNRVVQDGKSDHKLSIFRTSDGRGWGVKTLKSIKKGTFVTLYVGEVIKSDEAERRGKDYDEAGCTYLFDLDFNDPEAYPYSVDASKYGNVAHFINHSCNPNLGVYAVWVDCLDPNLPKLAMFALRDIPRNEELTFDYNIQLSGTKSRQEEQEADEKETDQEKPVGKKTICLCGADKCRKFIFA
ncbi:Histone-lysine N-methyltransferase SUV39H2 [Orchesella cincta]|uniref:Histone-lysine N-methyltransferase SUV39H2 n=1 Tax=Orchesella cincta TaxID=48709 RepID=A0A1D2MTJ8_ORCCI|nr:Histone-lysine N-methyltransferase SUV39H2 [Orchesella cincta]